ncbi:MAG: endonuclease/exonuclease/phosphatase family protein [Labedaea sp.]
MLRRPVRDAVRVPAPEDSAAEPAAKRRRRLGGRLSTGFLVLFALVLLGIAALRVTGIDGVAATVPAVTLTPYVVPGGLLLALVALVLRRRVLAVVALVPALVVAPLMLPRMVGNDQPAARGARVRVLSANVNKGGADVAALLDLVRTGSVDVLNVLELTTELLPRLDAAGLAELLPYRVVDPTAGGDGSGIFSRFPLRQVVVTPFDDLTQSAAVVDLPGPNDLEDVAVHVQSASHGSADAWRAELGRLPGTRPERVRVLAGDFNSTLDHAAFRRLIADGGYVDAAEQTGDGLAATWSSLLGPPITIDHVLADHRCAVADFAVHDLPGSDHNAVFADLALPS